MKAPDADILRVKARTTFRVIGTIAPLVAFVVCLVKAESPDVRKWHDITTRSKKCYCCAYGRVARISVMECRLQNGHCWKNQMAAMYYCQNGYCCTTDPYGKKLISSDTTKAQCTAVHGNWYFAYENALNHCGPTCWCCLGPGWPIQKVTTDMCSDTRGNCFATWADAKEVCPGEPVVLPNGQTPYSLQSQYFALPVPNAPPPVVPYIPKGAPVIGHDTPPPVVAPAPNSVTYPAEEGDQPPSDSPIENSVPQIDRAAGPGSLPNNRPAEAPSRTVPAAKTFPNSAGTIVPPTSRKAKTKIPPLHSGTSGSGHGTSSGNSHIKVPQMTQTNQTPTKISPSTIHLPKTAGPSSNAAHSPFIKHYAPRIAPPAPVIR